MSRTEQLTLSIAEGGIGPAPRLEAGEIEAERLDAFEADLATDRFFYRVPEDMFVPNMCVDGRLSVLVGPNSAGGTFTLVVADALTSGSYRQSGEKAPEHAQRVYKEVKLRNQKVGTHGDTNAHGPNCGCGAQDKLSPILEYMSRRSGDLQSVVESLGVDVGAELSDRIQTQSRTLLDSGYAATGAELSQASKSAAGEESVEILPGDHKEVVTVINTQEGTTLNRQGIISSEYGSDYQAFNVDVWAIKKACDEFASSPQEAHEMFVASLFYNVATAAVLAGPSMRVVVR